MKCQTSYQLGERYFPILSHTHSHTLTLFLTAEINVLLLEDIQPRDIQMVWIELKWRFPAHPAFKLNRLICKWRQISSQDPDLTRLAQLSINGLISSSTGDHSVYTSLWIRPESCIYHYCALILSLQYPFLFVGSRWILTRRKECKMAFHSQEEGKTGVFSQGVELEDSTLCSDWGHGYHEKSSCQSVANQWKIRLPLNLKSLIRTI